MKSGSESDSTMALVETSALGRVLITDLDNTLYNWVDYFARSFRAMIHALAEKSGTNEEVLIDACRQIFADNGSLEFPIDSVEQLGVFEDLSKEKAATLRNAMHAARQGVRKKRLALYSGVRELLSWAVGEHVPVIAVTNAPIEVVIERFRQLQLHRYFSAVAAPSIDPERAQQLMAKFTGVGGLFPVGSPGFPRVYALAKNEMKPSSVAYQYVLKDWQLHGEIAFVLGDSLQKDLAPAAALGAKTIWAHYGAQVEPENMDTLLKITPWSSTKVEEAYSQEFQADYTVDSASEVIAILRS